MIIDTVHGRLHVDDRHMQAHKDVLHLIPEAVNAVAAIVEGISVNTVDLERSVGYAGCVPTTDADKIAMVARPGRKTLSRVVFNRSKPPTSFVTVVIRRNKDRINLITAYCGQPAPREPLDKTLTDPREIAESKAFWKTHALILD